MNDKKQGTIWSYNPARMVGSIIDEKNQRWFFHRNTIVSGPPEPRLMMRVSFRPDLMPVQPGKLPKAREVELLEDGGAL